MMELWLRLEAFFEILSTRNVFIEIAAVGLALLLGGASALALRGRYRRQRIKVSMALSWEYFFSQSSVAVMPPFIVLVLVLLARSGLQATSLDVTLLGAAARLIAAYIVVRIGVLLFAASLGNKSGRQNGETRATSRSALAIAVVELGCLDPYIATLDSVGIAAGKSRITVWSVLNLLFILTLFMQVAAWISR